MTEPINEINCLGLKCPLPVSRLEKAVRRGDVEFMLVCDDPVSRIDIPVAVARMRGRIINTTVDTTIARFHISFA